MTLFKTDYPHQGFTDEDVRTLSYGRSLPSDEKTGSNSIIISKATFTLETIAEGILCYVNATFFMLFTMHHLIKWKTMIIKLRLNCCVQCWLVRDQRKLCEKLEITSWSFLSEIWTQLLSENSPKISASSSVSFFLPSKS